MVPRSFVMALSASVSLTLAAAAPAPKGWEFLSTETIGAKAFRSAHPKWDGRGVLIAILDTGVDLHLAGLLETPDGKPKILDARVFSSEGRADLEKAEYAKDEKGEAVYGGKDGKWLYGLERLPVQPAQKEKALAGYFKEEDFKNSALEDLNHNGRTDDVFGFVAFEVKDGEKTRWAFFLDTNGDGNMADEAELEDFAEGRRAFSLRGATDPHGAVEIARYALNFKAGQKEAALFMDDGAHGTHVAGIAAGYRIDGQEGYDGIAPGAQILAVKIGNNTLAGGATTPGSMVSAWRYAVEKAEELGMPLVIQMSFGTGSEREGTADAERLIGELLAEHPGVVATVSAGNEGPGLSTVGLPSCTRDALAVGAVLAKTTAKDLYGVQLEQDEMFSFSSRGGEVAKPDFVCPGFAASTVPLTEKGRNVMRGTSMSAPQGAGACALILSAARASGLPIRRDWVAAAIKRSARPLPGYGPLDQGAGLADIPAAWEVYKELARGNTAEPVLFEARTESPDSDGRKGGAIFWRGAFFPGKGESQEVAVSPVFPSDASAEFKANYYEAFDLSCPSDWVRVRSELSYMKAEQPLKFKISFDEARLSKAGLYQTTVKGYARGSSRQEGRGPDFSIPVAVVVPEGLSEPSGWRTAETIKGLKPAKVHRLFFRVPPGVGALNFTAEIRENERGSVSATLFDPHGREKFGGSLRPDRRQLRVTLQPFDLEPGIWELTLYANYANASPADAEVSLQGFPLARPLPEDIPLTIKVGKLPEAKVRILPALADTLRGRASGQLVGIVQTTREALKKPSFTRKFSVLPGESGVEFRFEVSPEDWGLFTDMAVIIADGSGKALVQDGLTQRKGTISFSPSDRADPKATYTLKVMAATADPDGSPRWALKLDEIHRYASPLPLSMTQGKGGEVVLYPDREAELTLSLESAPGALPAGAAWLAEAEIKDADSEALRLPMELRLVADEEGKRG